jgi:hypothetical protein
MKSPTDKTIAFTFMALPLVPAADRWTAKLTFPPGSGPETELPLAVTDAAGGPLASGSLELAGRRIKVVGGTASVVFADFVGGIHETTLCLHRRGCAPAPGALTFG